MSERVGPDPFTPVARLAGNATLTPTKSLEPDLRELVPERS